VFRAQPGLLLKVKGLEWRVKVQKSYAASGARLQECRRQALGFRNSLRAVESRTNSGLSWGPKPEARNRNRNRNRNL